MEYVWNLSLVLKLNFNNFRFSISQHSSSNNLFLTIAECYVCSDTVNVMFLEVIRVDLCKNVTCFDASKIRESIRNNF